MTFWEKTRIIFSNVWDFLGPFIKIFLTSAGTILAEVAMKSVIQVAATMGDADGDAKRKMALGMIKQELMTRGIELGVSVINASIEAAYQKLISDRK